ncbi:hypothetical protein B0T25DRAFT_556719 [Lasiosphaeria hispida]|uniref:Uncharacterized protein n=1 Tax=Lasiosphaeria hispida TaxID=260671 RepID=A0AAJ0M9T3_9PEZI|nr:hypothetical protein B0T25DRAFT_556719 [Lasiosphaeria hispida]
MRIEAREMRDVVGRMGRDLAFVMGAMRGGSEAARKRKPSATQLEVKRLSRRIDEVDEGVDVLMRDRYGKTEDHDGYKAFLKREDVKSPFGDGLASAPGFSHPPSSFSKASEGTKWMPPYVVSADRSEADSSDESDQVEEMSAEKDDEQKTREEWIKKMGEEANGLGRGRT